MMALLEELDRLIAWERGRQDEGSNAWHALRGACYVDAYQAVRQLIAGARLPGQDPEPRTFTVVSEGLPSETFTLHAMPNDPGAAIKREYAKPPDEERHAVPSLRSVIVGGVGWHKVLSPQPRFFDCHATETGDADEGIDAYITKECPEKDGDAAAWKKAWPLAKP